MRHDELSRELIDTRIREADDSSKGDDSADQTIIKVIAIKIIIIIQKKKNTK